MCLCVYTGYYWNAFRLLMGGHLCYLMLSDNFCKTRKYLLGLALGIPCVSYEWVSDSIGEVRIY